MANRSLSAAVPSSIISGSATITKQQPSSAFSRWRSAQQGYGGHGEGGRAASLNRSHDDLSSRMGESLDEESLMGGQDSCTGSLQRTVDELTQKCHKSITLLKSVGHNLSIIPLNPNSIPGSATSLPCPPPWSTSSNGSSRAVGKVAQPLLELEMCQPTLLASQGPSWHRPRGARTFRTGWNASARPLTQSRNIWRSRPALALAQ
jgi:hypothetical protein